MSTYNESLQSKIAELPIAKHLPNVTTEIDNFRKGEKGLFWFLKLAVIGAIGYLTWTYVLPPIFAAIGQLLSIAATGVMIVFLVLAAPAIFKLLRMVARKMHEAVIRHRPFDTLEDERKKMVINQENFRIAKQGIVALRQDMEVEAKNSEATGQAAQKKIISLKGKSDRLHAEMEDLVKTKGVAIKGEDEYVNKKLEWTTVLADANRVENQYNHAKNYVEKYGSRANVMKKMTQKLSMVETAMEIKIQDFDATVEMLKKDYEFGRKSNAATTAAKSALGFTKGWEMDLALEVVTANIAADIAISAGNLRDIASITSNYNLDSDELYANLNLIADNIQIGTDVVPDAKKFSNVEYQLTHDEKINSGGFGESF